MSLGIKAAKGIAVLAIVFAAATASDIVIAGSEDSIKQRIDLMRKHVLKNWKPIKAYAKKGKGSATDVQKNAQALNAAAKKITALFPAGTGRGAYPDKVTRALPAIWTDWKGFEKAAYVLANESGKLAKVAATGDAEAIRKQIGTTGKLGCGGCHKPFRGAKVKK